MMSHLGSLSGLNKCSSADAHQPRPSTLFDKAAHLLQRFRTDERGNVIVLGAVLIPVAMMAVGSSVSFSTGNATRTNMQAALDAAVLAGALTMDTSQSYAIEAAQNA